MTKNMHAEIKRFHSPDLDDLSSFTPPDPDVFCFLLQVMVGPAGVDAEESFDIEVCTPEWIRRNHPKDAIVVGRHKLIVMQYDFDRLADWLHRYVGRCAGESWEEIAAKLARLGGWEFEDYSPRS